jgi:glycosyltransferase involved in cell wall biosynthesis
MYNSEHVYQESQRSAPRILGPGDIRNLGNGLDHAPNLENISKRARLIVVLGSSYAHKNRGYALRLLSLVNSDSTSETRMILVGANPPFGGTLKEDQALTEELGLGNLVEFINWLPDEEIQLIISRASIVLYPSISEGFGLVPFEAAANGAAPLFALQTSLKGIAPGVPYFLTLVDIERDARVAATLLDSQEARETQIAYIDLVAEALTWEGIADELVSHLKLTLLTPSRVTEQFRKEFFASRKTNKKSLLHVRAHPMVQRMLPPGSRRANYFKSSYFKVFS